MNQDVTFEAVKEDTNIDENFHFKISMVGNKDLNLCDHVLDTYQLCYVIKGACIHTVYNKKATLVRGDVCFIKPVATHTIVPAENTEVQLWQIDFLPSFINSETKDSTSMENLQDFNYIQPFIATEEELLPKLSVNSENQLRIE